MCGGNDVTDDVWDDFAAGAETEAGPATVEETPQAEPPAVPVVITIAPAPGV